MPGADGNAFTLICACAIMGRARDCKACFRQLIAHDRKKGINLIEGDLGQLLEAIRDWSLGPLVGHAAGVHALSNKLLALPKHLKSMLGTVGIPEGDALLADETGGTLMIEAIQKTELVAVAAISFGRRPERIVSTTFNYLRGTLAVCVAVDEDQIAKP